MIIFVLIFGALLRLISINQSLWLDEATSALTTKMNLVDFFGKFAPGDFHPPLYYLALRAWGMVFGNSEVVLRSLSIVFGVLTIYLVYLIARELIDKRTGIIASLLLMTSGLHIYYSQEARMYAMSTFLVTLLIFSFVKILKQGRLIYWVLFSVTLGLIGLTDYLPLLVLPVFWIYGIFNKQNSKFWIRLFVSHIILGIFGLLWLPTFIKQLTSGINVTNTSPSWTAVLGKFSVKEVLLIPVKFIIGRVRFDNKFIYAFIVGFIFLIFGFLFYKQSLSLRDRSTKFFEKVKLIYLWLIVPLALALIISIKLPVLNYFRFLFILPAFYLILAFGVNAINKKWQLVFISLILVINLFTSFMYLTNTKFQREDWRGLASQIKNDNKAVVVFPTKSQQEALVYYGVGNRIVDVNDLNKNGKDIWLVRYVQPISDPQDMTRQKVEKLGYKKISELDFNGVVVWKYRKI